MEGETEVNIASFAGRVGTVKELKYTDGGKAVLNFSIAVDRGTSKNGDKNPPLWVNVALWEKQAEALAKYIRQGDPIAATGQVNVRAYESNGDPKAELRLEFARVTLLGSSKQENGGGKRQSGGRTRQQETEATSDSGVEISDEDIPF
jgi:single-strand DNA-binding protein